MCSLRRLRPLVAALAVAFLCLIAPTVATAASCPVGKSQMGCSLPPVFKGISGPPKGEIIPDVSNNNGPVNWAAVAAWQRSNGWKTTGAIFKVGEYTLDTQALANAAGMRAAGMVSIGYVFVRPGVQASLIIEWAKATGIKVVVLDEEVPGIDGTAARVTRTLEAAGYTVVVYHSQLNVIDFSAQGLPCWTADYGPSSRPDCTTGKTVAWQWTDEGLIPGISGFVDESITYGLLKLAAPVVKPVPKPKPKPAPNPKPAVKCVADAKSIPKACLKLFADERFGPNGINERKAVETYKYHRSKSIHAHIVYLKNRLWYVAQFRTVHGNRVKRKTPDWNFHRGYRFQRLLKDARSLHGDHHAVQA